MWKNGKKICTAAALRKGFIWKPAPADGLDIFRVVVSPNIPVEDNCRFFWKMGAMMTHMIFRGKPLAWVFAFALLAGLAAPARAGETFEATFDAIEAKDIRESVFTLFADDWAVVTAGEPPNSMVASFGGVGSLFSKPVAWCLMRADRYTLEKIRETNTFTMSFFDERHRGDILVLGSKSGRDTDKMHETRLTPVVTPGGTPAYLDARLILDLRLLEITRVAAGDFYTEEARDFIEAGYDKAGEMHKLVFGEIVGVWRRKHP